MASGGFKVNRAGVRALFKSAAMSSALEAQAKRVAASACAAEYANRATLPTKWAKIAAHYNENPEPYTGSSKTLSNTAVGVVRTSSLYGVVDENAHHTLENSL